MGGVNVVAGLWQYEYYQYWYGGGQGGGLIHVWIQDGTPKWTANNNQIYNVGNINHDVGIYYYYTTNVGDATSKGASGTKNYNITYTHVVTTSNCAPTYVDCNSWLEIHEHNDTVEGVPPANAYTNNC